MRNAVYDRDGWVCVACGTLRDLTIHHRVNRGSGGSKMYDNYAHLLTICSPCNTAFESDAAYRELALVYGWKILRNTKPPIDPTKVAVKYAEGNWYFLDNQGNRTLIPNGK